MTTEASPDLCKCPKPTYRWDRDLCSGCGSLIPIGPEDVESVAVWEDADDEWTDAIKAAHPTRAGTYDEYAMAMQMVGHRHSKGELVALVTWLLARDRLAKMTQPKDERSGR
jgi:hypothetical protein